jgi:hypothetical protein
VFWASGDVFNRTAAGIPPAAILPPNQQPVVNTAAARSDNWMWARGSVRPRRDRPEGSGRACGGNWPRPCPVTPASPPN